MRLQNNFWPIEPCTPFIVVEGQTYQTDALSLADRKIHFDLENPLLFLSFSDSRQAVIRQSSGSRQAVVRQWSGSRQVVIRQSSGIHQIVRQSSGIHQTVVLSP